MHLFYFEWHLVNIMIGICGVFSSSVEYLCLMFLRIIKWSSQNELIPIKNKKIKTALASDVL